MTDQQPIQFQLNDLADEYQRSSIQAVKIFGHHLKDVARVIESHENRDGNFNELLTALAANYGRTPPRTLRFVEEDSGIEKRSPDIDKQMRQAHESKAGAKVGNTPVEKQSLNTKQPPLLGAPHPVAAFQLALANYETALKALCNFQLGEQQ